MLPKSRTEQFMRQTLSTRRAAMIEITNDEQCGFLQLDDDDDETKMDFVEDHNILRMINSWRT